MVVHCSEAEGRPLSASQGSSRLSGGPQNLAVVVGALTDWKCISIWGRTDSEICSSYPYSRLRGATTCCAALRSNRGTQANGSPNENAACLAGLGRRNQFRICFAVKEPTSVSPKHYKPWVFFLCTLPVSEGAGNTGTSQVFAWY